MVTFHWCLLHRDKGFGRERARGGGGRETGRGVEERGTGERPERDQRDRETRERPERERPERAQRERKREWRSRERERETVFFNTVVKSIGISRYIIGSSSL